MNSEWMIRSMLAVWLMLFSAPVISQQQYLLFRHLSTSDGLSSPIVSDITQDHEGFIWIATNEGLNRYDGKSFEVFRPQKSDEHSLIRSTVYTVCIDSSDHVWAGTSRGISRFNKQTKSFTRFLLAGEKAGDELVNRITQLYCDHHGTMWAATQSGLFRYEYATNGFKRFLPAPQSPSGHENSIQGKSLIHDTLNNGLWCCVNYQLSFFDFNTETFFSFKNNPRHWSIFNQQHSTAGQDVTREGYLVIGDIENEVLIIYDFRNHRIVKEIHSSAPGFYILKATFLSTFVDANDKIWTGNWLRKPAIIDWKNETVDTSLYAEEYSGMIHSDNLNVVFISNDGTYWVGSSNGIYTYNPVKQPYNLFWLKENKNLINERITRILPDQYPYLWISTPGYLIHYNLLSRKENWIPILVNGRQFGLIFISKKNDNELWIGTHTGLLVFNQREEKFFYPDFPKELSPLRERKIQFVYSDSHNNLWIGTWNHGLFLQTAGGQWKWFHHNEQDASSLPYNGMLCICETHDGEIWLGLNGGAGVLKFDAETMSFINFKNDPADTNSLSNGVVNSIVEDDEGNLWMGTYGGGLNKFDRKKKQFTAFFDYDGLLNNFVFHITKDDAGKLWITTAKGVCVLNPSNHSFRTFPADLRYPSNNSEFSGIKNEIGLLYFFRERYFVEADPKKNFTDTLPLKVVISSVRIFDKEIPLLGNDSSLHFSYKQNFFSFEFSALDFIDPEKPEYLYLLERFDRDWNHSGNRNFASYTNVPPGDYVFKVKAHRTDQSGPVPVTSIPLTISPPFWQTLWFRFASAVALISLIWTLYRLRVGRVRKEEQQKAAFQHQVQEMEMKALRAQMNPHFIFNCMNSIQRYIYKNDQQSAVELLQKFAALIRKILDNSEKKMVPLSEDIALLEDYIQLEQLRTEKLFDFTIEMNENLSAEDIQVPSMLLQPFAENAIWHGLMPAKKKGMLKIFIGKSNHSLNCVIEDNGVGRNYSLNEEAKSSHRPKGLLITQERLQLMADQLKSESSIHYVDLKDAQGNARGTRVEIEIPVENGSDLS